MTQILLPAVPGWYVGGMNNKRTKISSRRLLLAIALLVLAI